MKKFFILSNHFKNRLLEILSFENRGSRQQQQHQNQRTNGPVNANLISWPSKAQNIQNLENIW